MRPILAVLLVALPLHGCALEESINPGRSKRAYEYRASITAPPSPVIVQVAGDPVVVPVVEPIAVTVEPEPVYVPPPALAPEPQPECVYGLYRIYGCVGGKVVML